MNSSVVQLPVDAVKTHYEQIEDIGHYLSRIRYRQPAPVGIVDWPQVAMKLRTKAALLGLKITGMAQPKEA